ncbi:MAG: transposase [Bryobacterales bacterium]|nr:transposase [Bryobacterales bacterium]
MTPPPESDVGKHWIDVFIDRATLERRFANTRIGRHAHRIWLRKLGVGSVVVEPNGRYHRELHQCLHDDRVTVVLANPQRMRNFTRSLGQQAKCDRIGTAMLARYAPLDGLEGVAPKPEGERILCDRLALRRKLVEQRDALRKHASETGSAAASLLVPCWNTLLPRSRRPTMPSRAASRPIPPCADVARSFAPFQASAP